MARSHKRDGMLAIADADAGPFGSPPGERDAAQLLESSVVVIDKPAGPTSHQVAAWVRDMLGVGQAGHGGTLDPQVTGVLPDAVGRATRSSPSTSNLTPFFCIASRCGPRAIKDTSAPASARSTPRYPPIAPAPKMQIRIN